MSPKHPSTPSSVHSNCPSTLGVWLGAAAALLAGLAILWPSVYPTITWWNSAELSLAASCLGISYPPGCLIAAILGWIVTVLVPGAADIVVLNALAALLGALAGALIGSLCARLLLTQMRLAPSVVGKSLLVPMILGAALGCLSFTFAQTLWENSTRLTPYVLTAVFTGLILWSMIRWWEQADTDRNWHWLFLMALLVGLDFCIHRTNALLGPGILLWILIRRPRTVLSARAWAAGVVGLALGLAVTLLMFPMAARDPFLNAGNITSWSSYWDYVSLKQAGGGFLVQFIPRKAPLWDYQVMDFLTAFKQSFAAYDGPWGWLGIGPALLGLIGLVALWRNSRRLAVALVALLLATSAVTVLYFNIPENFFRTLHRHYLPAMAIATVFIAYGAGALCLWAWHFHRSLRWATSIAALGLVVVAPASQIARNYALMDGSGDYTAVDFARNILSGLPENAILLVAGDNDTFPVWYVQGAEGYRTDVTTLNVPLLNTDWYVAQTIRRNPAFPLPPELTAAPILPKPWADTTVQLAVAGDPIALGLPADAPIPGAIELPVASSYGSGYLMPGDQAVLQMLALNRWQRPVYVCVTVGNQALPYLEPYLRLEGLCRRLVPLKDPTPNIELLQRNLMERYEYRGYADPNVRLEQVTVHMAMSYCAVYLQLAMAQSERRDEAGARATIEHMRRMFPPDRIPLPEQMEID